MKKRPFWGLICGLLVLVLVTGCSKMNDDSVKILSSVKINWSDLKISFDDADSGYPLKVSDFIDNGWNVSSDDDEQTLNKIIKSDEGYNYLTLKNGGLLMNVYVDNRVADISVKDANIVNFTVKKESSNNSTSFEVDGFKLGSIATDSDIKSGFGTENYEILSGDDYYTYHYYKVVNDLNIQLEIVTKIKTNEITQISLYHY